MSGSSRQSGGIALWILLALFAVGIVSLVIGLTSDARSLDFGLLTASFLYLLGISQAGVVFCAITRLVKAQWAKPYYRLAELSTLAFAPFALAIFLLLFVVAGDELFYWLTPDPDEHLSPWLNSNWLLVRNLAGLLFFYGISFVYVRKSVRADLAGGSEADYRAVEHQLYMLSPWIIIAFILCNTLLAWDFAMMIIPHWHSTVFPIYFWFGSLFAGLAALIVFPALLGRSAVPDSPFGGDQVRYLGMMITAFTLLWLYFFWAQFFVIWFGNLPAESEPLWRQMYGHYSPFFWTMMAGCFFVPFVAFIFAVVRRSLVAMCIIGFGINLGIWISKYLMVVPALSPDNEPFRNLLDIGLAVGMLAGFMAIVMLSAQRLPMYSRWEMSLKPIPRR
jgi:molybdopterin-containing oxidoreductase family membrane subunit